MIGRVGDMKSKGAAGICRQLVSMGSTGNRITAKVSGHSNNDLLGYKSKCYQPYKT